MKGARVYDVRDIYLHKVAAVAGTRQETDAVGRVIQEGRNEPRDAFDLYGLSRAVRPLHAFLAEAPPRFHKGIVHWYRTFSRQDMKLATLNLDVTDPRFDAREMISHLEAEIRLFVQGQV